MATLDSLQLIKLYYYISKAKEISAQLKGGKGKGSQASPKPLYGEICEQVKTLSDQGEAIPITTLAKLVKFKLISIKTKDKERRENERKVFYIYLNNSISILNCFKL